MQNQLKMCAVIFCLSFLSACSGGGGDESSSDRIIKFELDHQVMAVDIDGETIYSVKEAEVGASEHHELLRSFDRGDTWETIKSFPSIVEYRNDRIKVSPYNNGHLYLLTVDSLEEGASDYSYSYHISYDYGTSWIEIYYKVAWFDRNINTLWGERENYQKRSSLVKSTDAGSNWEYISEMPYKMYHPTYDIAYQIIDEVIYGEWEGASRQGHLHFTIRAFFEDGDTSIDMTGGEPRQFKYPELFFNPDNHNNVILNNGDESYISDNGGTTWSDQIDYDLTLSDGLLWREGDENTLLKSNDFGLTWEEGHTNTIGVPTFIFDDHYYTAISGLTYRIEK